VTPATLFQAGSISKPVAAVGAMLLVERRAGSRRREAGEYEGESIGRVKITVEGDHLLVHSEGTVILPLYPETADTFFSLTGGKVMAKRVR